MYADVSVGIKVGDVEVRTGRRFLVTALVGIPRIAWPGTGSSAAGPLPAARTQPLIHESAGGLVAMAVAEAGGRIHIWSHYENRETVGFSGYLCLPQGLVQSVSALKSSTLTAS
ncbi:hypothetical protein CRG98_049969 [Punica granatum]|uniref:Uncharacterized protein n=1 Tax=Punica granatum TaxID=22663 RepID=A0A2I0H1E0_PUNGR|nr:hypothetical protein CRG98_049969 [Punica granatum]